jgi:hypothetical protein
LPTFQCVCDYNDVFFDAIVFWFPDGWRFVLSLPVLLAEGQGDLEAQELAQEVCIKSRVVLYYSGMKTSHCYASS